MIHIGEERRVPEELTLNSSAASSAPALVSASTFHSVDVSVTRFNKKLLLLAAAKE